MPDFIELWRKIILGSEKNWVAFENGTCVILMQPEKDLTNHAKRLLTEYGPVHAGTPSADFEIIRLDDKSGWIVGCHHPDILTYIDSEFGQGSPTDLQIGLLGRSNRDQDAKTLHVIHVEDKRNQ